jgi:membrane-bound lytic murein transglycosylase D
MKTRFGFRISDFGFARTMGRGVPFVLLAFFVLVALCPIVVAQTATQKKASPPDKRVSDLEKDVVSLRRELAPYSLDAIPESMMLCDKKVPLMRDDLRERYEREFFQLVEHRGLMTVMVKRYFKYYATINEEIQRANVPADLIYLVITESYLNPRAVSKAQAAGLWQFIQETGKREGLIVNDQIDERYTIRKSTHAALTHLKRLYGEFGDWLIAMAAYNAGAQRLKDALANQGTRDFFELYLPEETERYIFRIMALKEIITNREKYGIAVFDRELYKPVSLSEVTIEVHRETPTSVLSKSMDVPYRAFRENNLHIRKYKLAPGTYHISVPTDKREAFLKRLQGNESMRVVKAQ